MKLPRSFYLNPDVVSVAKELIGKTIFTCFDGQLSGGMITETEAYEGVTDRASHAYKDRRTARTEVMYQVGGTAYVYLCYGIHHLFNVVSNEENIPHAVLIRGIKPTTGIDMMLKRFNGKLLNKAVLNGPGKVGKALGIRVAHSGCDLLGDQIWIEDTGIISDTLNIKRSTRIGIDYAGQDALLSYRFFVDEF